FGEAPERRPWAIKREDRPAAFAGRSFCLSGTGIARLPTSASILSQSGTRPSRKGRSSVHVIVRNALEKIVGISGEKIVAHYKIPPRPNRRIIRLALVLALFG